ncbi:MAG: PAS domain-containing protein [Sedimenticola sp.]
MSDNRETTFEDDEIIVLKIDAKGRIFYVNRVFMRVANYPEQALLGRQHSMIRHPDMPQGIVRWMWNTLEQGHEFLGYVKNISSGGRFFWAFTSITPDWGTDDELLGYHYVGRKVNASALKVIEPLYREMLGLERAQQLEKDAERVSIELLKKRLTASSTSYDEFVLSL